MKKAQKQALAVGAGVAALAAAATGVYFMTGKNAKNRKKVAAWAEKAKREVVQELKKMERVTKPAYNKAVDTVAKRYKQLQKVDPAELAAMGKELKSYWNTISKQMNGTKRTPAKRPAAKKAPARKPARRARA